MKPREFTDKVLHDLKLHCPDLYKAHILKRRAAFIAENAPPESDVAGKRVGYAGKNLRMLSAIGYMLINAGNNTSDHYAGKELNALEACRFAVGKAHQTMGELCFHMFWDFVSARFGINTKEGAAVLSDWSIITMPHETVPRASRQAESDMFVNLIGRQADIASANSFAAEVLAKEMEEQAT